MTGTAKRTVVVLLLLALVSVPAVLTSQLVSGALVGLSTLACFAGLIAGSFGVGRPGVVMSALLGVAGALALPASEQPWLAAALMVSCGVAMGAAARFGVAGFVSLAPVTVGFALAEPPPVGPVSLGIVLAASALFGTLLGWLVRRRLPPKELRPLHAPRAWAYGAMLALLTGISAWFVVDLQVGHAGAWLLMTFFVVIQPYLQDGWRKALERGVGTIAGFLIAIAIGLVVDLKWLLFLIGIVAIVLGSWDMIKGKPYWRRTIGMTVGVVLTQGASTSVVSVGEQRLLATVIGVCASLAAMAILDPIYRRTAKAAGVDHY